MNSINNMTVFETDEYEKFNKLCGNRNVTPARVKGIKDSILRVGYQPVPILVNENMEVIDGQGRLEALKELSLPVLYIVKPGLTIDDCISMNIKMKNWSEIDYIRCYADMGNQNYINLVSLIEEYKTLPHACIFEVALGAAFGSGNKHYLLNGKVECTEITYDMHEALRWLTAIKPYLKANSGTALKVLAKLNTLGLIDRSRMLEAFERYSDTRKVNARSADDILIQVNDIYNYNRRNLVFFADKYRSLSKKKKGTREVIGKN